MSSALVTGHSDLGTDRVTNQMCSCPAVVIINGQKCACLQHRFLVLELGKFLCRPCHQPSISGVLHCTKFKIKMPSFWKALGKVLFLSKSRAHLHSSSPGLAPSCLPHQASALWRPSISSSRPLLSLSSDPDPPWSPLRVHPD